MWPVSSTVIIVEDDEFLKLNVSFGNIKSLYMLISANTSISEAFTYNLFPLTDKDIEEFATGIATEEVPFDKVLIAEIESSTYFF